MKNSGLIILLIIKVSIAITQVSDPLIQSWDKVNIVDAYDGWYHFNNKFQISRKDSSLCFSNQPDSIINKINPELINQLLYSLKNDSLNRAEPLAMFGRDSLWLANNAERLWYEYLGDRDETDEIDVIAIMAIKNCQSINEIVWSIQGTDWTDDHPYVYISIIDGLDTTKLISWGQYPYMLPWEVNGKLVYNSKISSILAQLLPDNMRSNKSRLAGRRFNYNLVSNIYRLHIEDTAEYIIAKNKYPKQFLKLENEFEIIDAGITYMTSIEWGGLMGKPCLELVLKDSSISNNIQFSVILGNRIFLNSINPIIKKKGNLLSQLSNNPIYNYTIKNESCSGEIHFVNRKSLSNEAKREFLEDNKSIQKEQFEGNFKHAIFYELIEYREGRRSFSRWIFLKNGTIILWQIQGDYLMNLSPEFTMEQGYVCRILTKEELLTLTKDKNMK